MCVCVCVCNDLIHNIIVNRVAKKLETFQEFRKVSGIFGKFPEMFHPFATLIFYINKLQIYTSASKVKLEIIKNL